MERAGRDKLQCTCAHYVISFELCEMLFPFCQKYMYYMFTDSTCICMIMHIAKLDNFNKPLGNYQL